MPDDILVLRSTLLKGILSNDSELVTISVPSLLDRLEKAQLEQNRELTIPFVKMVLSIE